MEGSWVASVDAYVQRYSWQLLDRDEFVRLVRDQIDTNVNTSSVHAAILCVYSRALYRVCSGSEGCLRQEQAYSELALFLDQIAARRYGSVRADATQGALERIFRSFTHCRQPETFLAFALQKLRDAAQSEFRSLDRAETDVSLDTEGEECRSQIASADPDPVDLALQKDTRRRLIACAERFVQKHPRAAHQLAVLWLKYINDLDDPTIAKQLNKTAQAVQVLRSRGMAHLRRDPDLCALAAELGFAAPRCLASA
jgi:DNA-directed RNA polymerase specialized sigma24 family protein